ncbi:HAD hydrolase family protein [Schaalia meyeri]|uniref:HAD hydrolase family protein n=1 Tax=Schaalia meyeri TaxID=52773 RepID=A0AAP9Y7G0_9ACTO|nr:HAD hydrolase family protein [Schaalia meyeri]
MGRNLWIGTGDSENDIPLFSEVDDAIAVNAQSSWVIDAADCSVGRFSEGVALALNLG